MLLSTLTSVMYMFIVQPIKYFVNDNINCESTASAEYLVRTFYTILGFLSETKKILTQYAPNLLALKVVLKDMQYHVHKLMHSPRMTH